MSEGNGSLLRIPPPFALSLSKGPSILSLSKGRRARHPGFDKLSPNG
jgi:hypothetical protein